MFDQRSRYHGGRPGLCGLLRSAGFFATSFGACRRHYARCRRQRRPRLPHVGDTGRQRRHRLRGRLLGQPRHLAMAGQPRHFCPEGQHRERLQCGSQRDTRRQSVSDRACLVDSQPVHRRAAGWQPLRAAAQQSGRYGGCLWQPSTVLPATGSAQRTSTRAHPVVHRSARQTIRWSASASAA